MRILSPDEMQRFKHWQAAEAPPTASRFPDGVFVDEIPTSARCSVDAIAVPPFVDVPKALSGRAATLSAGVKITLSLSAARSSIASSERFIAQVRAYNARERLKTQRAEWCERLQNGLPGIRPQCLPFAAFCCY